MSPEEMLIDGAMSRRIDRIREAIAAGADPDSRCDDGATALLLACLEGDLEAVRLLLDVGADPKLVADEPAADIYAPRPLDLVMQCQFLLDWRKFTPIFTLLVERGAMTFEGNVPSAESEKVRERHALEWQSRKS